MCFGRAPRRSFVRDPRCAARRRAQPPRVRRQRFLIEFGSRLRRDAARVALRTMLRCARVPLPQMPACTCSPPTFALRWTCCCSVLRGRRAPSPSSRTSSRRAPRRDAGPFLVDSGLLSLLPLLLTVAARGRGAARRPPRRLCWRRRAAGPFGQHGRSDRTCVAAPAPPFCRSMPSTTTSVAAKESAGSVCSFLALCLCLCACHVCFPTPQLPSARGYA